MANYLPVLIVSVTAGIPDDASFQPLPRGQVDYLSHNWQEEDVWRSWRNMTKQKNEIANGVRLENASWRTWWKQRNNLKTVTPETLNWLKDSDVTWLYGPLHTAVDWAPPPRPDPVPDTVAAPPTDANALDLSGHGRKLPRLAKKPILKHRSISEMLTSALPASPMYEYDSFDLGSVDEDEEEGDEYDVGEHVPWEGATSPDGSPRPGLLRIKSDTNIMRRFGRTRSSYTRKKSPPPRIIAQSAEAAAAASASTSTSTSLSSTQHDSDDQTARRLSVHPRSASSTGTRSGSSDTNSSSKSDADNAVVPPPKKHISFNTFVEQCIAIEKPKGKGRASAQNDLKPWPSEGDRSDDGYDEDEEDSPYEGGQSPSDSDSADDVAVDDEDQDSDDMLEMRPTRRSSVSSINLRQSQLLRATSLSSDSQPSSSSSRPTLRRTSTSRSASDKEREHVTIAPIAPTILKTGNITSTANPASSYRGGVGLFSFGGPYASSGGGCRGPSDEEYDDYYEETVGTTPGVGTGIRRGLVYQPPEGSIYSIVRQGSVGPFDPFNQPMVSSPSCDDEAEGDGFDYFTGPDLGEDFTGRRRYLQPPHQQQQQQGLGSMWKTRGVVREDEEDERREQRERRATLDVVDGRAKARTPSPEWTPPSNPRVASIRSEEGYGLQPHLPVQAHQQPSTYASDTLPPPSPTIAIPTPGISPAHQLQHDTLSPSSISPSPGGGTHSVLIPVSSQEFVDDTTPVAQRTAFLSPTERSPIRGRDRGRSPPCTSASPSTAHANGYVTSGSATSSPSAPGSRSVSESRSENSQWDSRGRSRTSGSGSGSVSPALFSDPERGERERGRSRSRSFSSGGTGSPLGSVSPSSSRPPPTVPMAYRGVYSSTSAANTLAEKHSGREIRDRRGVRLYRKTSEDYVPRLVQGDRDKEKAKDKGDGRGRERGRERVGRVSESLSPPYKPSPPPACGRGAVPPGPSALGKEMRQHAAAQAETLTGGGFSYQAYAVNSFGRPRIDQPILSLPTSPNLSTSTAKTPKVVVEEAELSADQADPASEDGSGASAETVHDVRAGSSVKSGGRAKEKGIRVVVEDVEDGRTPPARRTPHPERATKSTGAGAANRGSEPAPRTTNAVTKGPSTRRDKGTETTLKVATDPPPISRSSSTEDEPQSPGSLVGRAADMVSSARRGLLGAIWGS